MPKFVCIQAGHQNAPQNCDISLRKSTGAPGEADFTIKTRDRLSQILISKGIQVQLVDSCFNCDPNADNKDYDLFLALHYDAYVNGSIGGFADYPEPSTDGATAESQRITKVINEVYFPESGIQYSNKSNANTRYYYMWKFLSAKTPCVLLECGTGQNPHDKVILQDTERVATAIARAICKALNIPFDAPPTDPCANVKKELETANKTISEQKTKIGELEAQCEDYKKRLKQINDLSK